MRSPDQVTALLERSATDVNCGERLPALPGRPRRVQRLGPLDVAAAVGYSTAVSAARPFEPNDDAGGNAARLGTRVTSVKATIDFWDDQIDVYRVEASPRRPEVAS